MLNHNKGIMVEETTSVAIIHFLRNTGHGAMGKVGVGYSTRKDGYQDKSCITTSLSKDRS